MNDTIQVQAIKPTKVVVFVPAPNGLAKVLFQQGAYSENLLVPGQFFQNVRTNPATKELTITVWPLAQYAIEFSVPMAEPPKAETVAPNIITN
jgi:hypothetical protein